MMKIKDSMSAYKGPTFLKRKMGSIYFSLQINQTLLTLYHESPRWNLIDLWLRPWKCVLLHLPPQQPLTNSRPLTKISSLLDDYTHFNPAFPPPALPLPKAIIPTAASYFPKIKSHQIIALLSTLQRLCLKDSIRAMDKDLNRWPWPPFQLHLPRCLCPMCPAPRTCASFHLKCPSFLICYLLKSNNLSGPSSNTSILSQNSFCIPTHIYHHTW